MIDISGTRAPGQDEILTSDALAFLGDLQVTFGSRREALLQARRGRQAALDGGADLDFDPATADLRADDWTVP
ncbi:MAG: malate synthase, partial [Chloroflexota bacterium]|nr:malate synthase [Chloroflexota bacterium]